MDRPKNLYRYITWISVRLLDGLWFFDNLLWLAHNDAKNMLSINWLVGHKVIGAVLCLLFYMEYGEHGKRAFKTISTAAKSRHDTLNVNICWYADVDKSDRFSFSRGLSFTCNVYLSSDCLIIIVVWDTFILHPSYRVLNNFISSRLTVWSSL